MSFATDLDNALSVGICSWLANGGNAALGMAIVNGVRIPGGQVPSLAAGLGLLALNAGCNFDPDAGAPQAGDYVPPAGSCIEVVSGDKLKFALSENSGGWGGNFRKFISLVNTGVPGSFGTYQWRLTYEKADGLTYASTLPRGDSEIARHSFYVISGGVCKTTSDGAGNITLPPVTYTSPTTNCEYIVEFESWYVLEDGNVAPVAKISAGTPQARASGGIIGGCNFDPVIYIGGPGGPGGSGGGGGGPYFAPWEPSPDGPDGEPWWLPFAKAALAGATSAAVSKALDELFKTPYPAGSYEIKGVCERDPDGNPMDVTRSSTYASEKGIDAVLTRLDAIADLFQYHKELRQPICRHPRGSGDLVTVNFVSDAPSPQGEKPLRKFLRYRDQTGSDAAVHGAHWRDFSWQAGPVIVGHENGAWGQLKVWALSADEGKRVIRHAGSVAGVDPDSDGDWVITSSSAPRYGQTGTMRVEVRAIGEQGEKYIRVTKRSDPNGLPLLPGV